jgi:predicted acylesterase/phospholipase RssA
MLKSLLLASISMLLIGCADAPQQLSCPEFDQFRLRLDPTPPPRTAAVAEARTPGGLEAAITSALSRPSAKAPAAGRSILVLSGGGEWGAFGAGFLQAWTGQGQGEASRPEFDIVTGVSTGALQATFAFLGKDEDSALVTLYRPDSEGQLIHRRGSLFFLTSASMADLKPLDGIVHDQVSFYIDKVADAARSSGRRLFVATVDGVDGETYAVDLTAIALASGLARDERVACYSSALLASSAEPLVFRQIRISGKPYLDGGVRKSVFLTQVVRTTARALARSRGTAGFGPADSIYVLMNGETATSSSPDFAAKDPTILSTLNRVRELTFNQVELSSIYEVGQAAGEAKVYTATADGNACKAQDPNAIFDPGFMRCLEAYGAMKWSGGQGWTPYR